jgi:hypothetical protein
MLAGPGFTEECVECIISSTYRAITWHATVGLDAMLQAVKLPAGISDLDTGLSYMDTDDFSHFFFSFVTWLQPAAETAETTLPRTVKEAQARTKP